MMDKDQAIREAEQYVGEKDCYIRVEKKLGEGCNVCMAGGAAGLVFGIGSVINRFSKIGGVPFSDVLEFLQDAYNHGDFDHCDVIKEGKLEKRDTVIFREGTNE